MPSLSRITSTSTAECHGNIVPAHVIETKRKKRERFKALMASTIIGGASEQEAAAAQ